MSRPMIAYRNQRGTHIRELNRARALKFIGRGDRRSYNRKTGRYGKFRGIMGTVQSDQCFVKLPYSDTVPFNSGASPSAVLYCLNTISDPDQAARGHRPLDAAQYQSMYNKYTVHGCNVELTIISDNSVSITGVICASDTNSSGASVLVSQEYKYAKPFEIGAVTGNNKLKYKRYFSIRKMQGIDSLTNYEQNQALFTANPADPIFFWVKVCAADLTTSITKTYMSIKLTYYVTLFDSLNPAQSSNAGATGVAGDTGPNPDFAAQEPIHI